MGKTNFKFKIIPSSSEKSSKDVIDKIVKQTIEKVLAQSQKSFYNDGK
ncbi:hypothetical protein [Priestia megaterium]|nr:hypothetical protein [Priestia megaterium]